MFKKILLAGILALGLAKAQVGVKPVDGNSNELAKGPVSTVSWSSATAQNATLGLALNSWNAVEVEFLPGAGTVTGGVFTFETPATLGTSSGNVQQQCYRLNANASESTYTLTTAAVKWQCAVGGNANFQVRLSTAMTGTASFTVNITPYSGQVHIDTVTLAGGGNTIGNVVINGNGTYGSNQQSVTASAVALGTNTTKTVCIEALSTNLISVYIGATGVTTSTGFELIPGAGTCKTLSNTNLIFVVASTTGASVTYDWTN